MFVFIHLRFRLLTRVHEVLKQCRDLKTDNSQKERRIDDLMEENGSLAAQVWFPHPSPVVLLLIVFFPKVLW